MNVDQTNNSVVKNDSREFEKNISNEGEINPRNCLPPYPGNLRHNDTASNLASMSRSQNSATLLHHLYNPDRDFISKTLFNHNFSANLADLHNQQHLFNQMSQKSHQELTSICNLAMSTSFNLPAPINMEQQEQEKTRRKRERNRIAAAKCREKKVNKINYLENQSRVLKEDLSNMEVERNYYKNKCSCIVEILNRYIRDNQKNVPILEITKIIEQHQSATRPEVRPVSSEIEKSALDQSSTSLVQPNQ